MDAITRQEVRKTFPFAASTDARRFVGKTGIVVGAFANVDKALAESLAHDGADMAIHYNLASRKRSGRLRSCTGRGRPH